MSSRIQELAHPKQRASVNDRTLPIPISKAALQCKISSRLIALSQPKHRPAQIQQNPANAPKPMFTRPRPLPAGKTISETLRGPSANVPAKHPKPAPSGKYARPGQHRETGSVATGGTLPSNAGDYLKQRDWVQKNSRPKNLLKLQPSTAVKSKMTEIQIKQAIDRLTTDYNKKFQLN